MNIWNLTLAISMTMCLTWVMSMAPRHHSCNYWSCSCCHSNFSTTKNGNEMKTFYIIQFKRKLINVQFLRAYVFFKQKLPLVRRATRVARHHSSNHWCCSRNHTSFATSEMKMLISRFENLLDNDMSNTDSNYNR